MIWRIICSIGVLAAMKIAMVLNTPVAGIGASRMAGLQMTNSDDNAVFSMLGMHMFSGLGAAILAVTAILLLVI